MGDGADNGLASGMDVHMLDSNCLIAAAPQLRESLCMLSADPKELHSHVAIALQHWNVLRPSNAGQEHHRDVMSGSYLHR
ncbi:hypothetical protein DC522_31065 [Microvirga sp. KLBC 81]|nr:hypothetical protein DC522_31065 [Microvirga sp. KLBC 81]